MNGNADVPLLLIDGPQSTGFLDEGEAKTSPKRTERRRRATNDVCKWSWEAISDIIDIRVIRMRQMNVAMEKMDSIIV